MTVDVKLLQHSYSPDGISMYSFEVEIPRIILAEWNTHGMLNTNAQSSRAVPTKKLIEEVRRNPYMPSHWGKNQKGMQAYEEQDSPVNNMPKEAFWDICVHSACDNAQAIEEAGYHKQIANRIIEPYSHTKLVVSGTEWNNFFNLRIHKDAEPNIREMAIKIYEVTRSSAGVRLYNGEWHLPYISMYRQEGHMRYVFDNQYVSLSEAIRISLACVAQVSYRSLNTHPAAIDRIYNSLFPSDGAPIHGSPAQHLATPFKEAQCKGDWQEGETHRDRDGYSWSAQLRGWCQYRKLIPNENVTTFTHETFLERLATF